MAIAALWLKPMFYSSSREAEQLRLAEFSRRYASTAIGIPEPTMTNQSTTKETEMTTHIDTNDLIRESLLDHYNMFTDRYENPKYVLDTLRALRRAHNFYAAPHQAVKPNSYEKLAKKFKKAGYVDMEQGHRAEGV